MKNILIACEESQRICIEFRRRGFNAFSCDTQECSGGHPEWHIQQDVLPLLNGNCAFQTMDGKTHNIEGKWELIMAHPPCTYLTVCANKLYVIEKYGEKAIQRQKDREEAVKFFMEFTNADCEHIAIENPVGVMSTRYRKPNQIIQPYYFGDPVRKTTCLWLKNLPLLTATNIVDFECIHSNGKSGGYSGPAWVVKDENGKVLSYKDPRVAKARSKTYEGIAKAIATQWSVYLYKDKILEAYNDFTSKNYDSDPIDTLPENGILDLAFTSEEFGDGEYHDLQVSFDLNKFAYIDYIDGRIVSEQALNTIGDFIQDLNYCDFDSLLCDCIHEGAELYGDL